MSDRSLYTSLPPSISSSSLNTVALSPPSNTFSASTTGATGFWGGISSVWAGLKQAAGAQVEGFWRGAGSWEVEGGRVGEKRERLESGGAGGERKGKKRRVEQQQQGYEGDFLFDGVPPLMPPYSHASPLPPTAAYASSSCHLSSSPIASRSASHPSSSPEASRRALRPYTNPSYADVLMHAAETSEDILPPLPSTSSRNSAEQGGLRSLSGRRKLSVQGVPSATNATTSALAGTGGGKQVYTRGHGRTQSHAVSASGLSSGVPLPNPRHVHFAPIPSSTSLPNLAVLSGSGSSSKSPKTPRKSTSSSSSSKSPSSSSAKTPPVSSVLLGDDVSLVWARAKEEEKRKKEDEKRRREGREREVQERRERRIRELEGEVEKLKGELSAKKAPPPSSSLLPKSPRASFPPPPPPPPPPPIGKPHPLLLSARQSLKSTPPRPSTSSSFKRRLSTLGGEGSNVDMGAFLEELGGKRGRLRKVGMPDLERRKREKRERDGEGGELGEVLQRAFARKFSGTASPSTPGKHLPTSRSTFNLSSHASHLKNPDWSSPRPSSARLPSSRSQPTGLSSLVRSTSASSKLHIPPVPPLPPQPFFTSSGAHPPPRSSSLVSTETTVFGTAVTTDEVTVAAGPATVSSSTLTSISPSASTDSLAALTSAPPEVSTSAVAPPQGVTFPSSRLPATPVGSTSSTNKEEKVDPSASASASERLSRARRRSGDGSPLPGLDLGRARPVTPGRAKKARKTMSSDAAKVVSTPGGGGSAKKRSRTGEEGEEEDELILVSQTPRSSKGKGKEREKKVGSSSPSSAKKRRTPSRKDTAHDGAYDVLEEGVLTGFGGREQDGRRVFGRA
ncbi:hypothetical protein JCM8547_008967 [Rhodosporidiobolus lusitaniae]